MLSHSMPKRCLFVALAAAPSPELVFNYLGQFDQLVADSKRRRASSSTVGAMVRSEGMSHGSRNSGP